MNFAFFIIFLFSGKFFANSIELTTSIVRTGKISRKKNKKCEQLKRPFWAIPRKLQPKYAENSGKFQNNFDVI